jgi:predicted MFS family arabinose efflux permease
VNESSADTWRFATLATIGTVTAVVSSLGAPLMPSVAEAYDVPLSSAQWILTSTLLAGAVVTPVLGRWASGRLRRTVMLATLVVTLIGSVVAALPLGLGWLIAGRTLQGIGLGLAPLAFAVARDLWSGQLLASRLSWLSLTTVAGAGLGYPATALVADLFGLAGAYWFGAGLLALTLLLAVIWLPHDSDGDPASVDLVGVVLLSAGSVALLLGVTRAESWGWGSLPVLALLTGGVGTLLGWVAWTRSVVRRGGQPLVDLRLATRAGVRGVNAVALCLGAGMYALLTFAVVVVRADGSAGYGIGAGVTAAGLVLVPYALLSVGGSRVALLVARRFSPRALLPVGSTVFASSLLALAFWHDSLWQVLAAMALGGLGSGFTFSSMPMLMVPHVPAAETGSAMSFNLLMRYLGIAVGSAASVALLATYGGDGTAFRAAALTFAALCAAVGGGGAGRPGLGRASPGRP